jgi:hypothetical protein
MDRSVMKIDHHDPKCRFQITMSAGCESVDRAWESLADGVEISGEGVASRLSWDGNVLVFVCRSHGSDSPWTMSWTYELLNDGRRLRAVEQMRGSIGDHDNTWIFDRK